MSISLRLFCKWKSAVTHSNRPRPFSSGKQLIGSCSPPGDRKRLWTGVQCQWKELNIYSWRTQTCGWCCQPGNWAMEDAEDRHVVRQTASSSRYNNLQPTNVYQCISVSPLHNRMCHPGCKFQGHWTGGLWFVCLEREQPNTKASPADLRTDRWTERQMRRQARMYRNH